MGRPGPLLLLLLSALAPPAFADEEDVDRVRRLRGDGTILPLARILHRAGLEGSALLEVELEEGKGGRLIYEIEYLGPDRRVHEARFDARSGRRLGGK